MRNGSVIGLIRDMREKKVSNGEKRTSVDLGRKCSLSPARAAGKNEFVTRDMLIVCSPSLRWKVTFAVTHDWSGFEMVATRVDAVISAESKVKVEDLACVVVVTCLPLSPTLRRTNHEAFGN